MAENNTGKLVLNNTAYDIAKQAAMVWLPGAATLYAALAVFWGFPEPEKVVGSITAIDAFLGVILGISTASYNNGKLDNPDNPKVEVVSKVVTVTPTEIVADEPAPVDGEIFPDLKP